MLKLPFSKTVANCYQLENAILGFGRRLSSGRWRQLNRKRCLRDEWRVEARLAMTATGLSR
jgi:hypothetical protein